MMALDSLPHTTTLPNPYSLHTRAVAMAGSSSASPLPFNFTKLQLSCPGSSSSSSPTQNANVVIPQDRDLPEKDLKRKRSSGGVVPNNNMRPISRNEEEEKDAGISTELVLYEDRCKIKKKLTKSDLDDHFSRLMLPGPLVEAHVLPLMGEEMARQVKSGGGMKVVVRDADTRDDHMLDFCRWLSSRSYVLKRGWTNLFVKRRGLEVGDEIGMYWDKSKFHFTVHRKVARGTSNTAA